MNFLRLLETLERHEGFRGYAYDDATGEPIRKGSVVKGHPTIGFGRMLEGDGVSRSEASQMLRHDTHRAWGEAQGLDFFEGLNESRKEVIVNMVFNLGLPRFLGFRKMIAALQRSDWKVAAEEMLDSKWARQVGGRAIELARVMERGYFDE